MSSVRYAIYYTPEPGEDLARFGTAVLGYDAASGQTADQLVPPGFSPAQWTEATAEPRRYGFHATLKAPFYLATGFDENSLRMALDEFATTREATRAELQVQAIGSFVALVPTFTPVPLQQLEHDIVEWFDRFRAPLRAEDLNRRLAVPLTPRQKASLERYGYPYVHADFRFHMTLTGSLDPRAQHKAAQALDRAFRREVHDPHVIFGSLALFRQDDRDSRFHIVARAPFAASTDAAAERG